MNAKFDRDFQRGQVGERFLDWLVHPANSAKVEVKSDYMAARSGNLAIEFACRGKPSGIRTTASDYYLLVVQYKAARVCLILPTPQLRAVVEDEIKHGRRSWRVVTGGDNHVSRMVLAPMDELLLELHAHILRN